MADVHRRIAHPVRVGEFGNASVEVRLVPLMVPSTTVLRTETRLAPEERTRARRGTPPVYARRVLLRAALRELVGEHLGLHPAEVPLRSTPAGRPELAGRAAGHLDVGCSAGNGVGLVALAHGARVGVDLEPVGQWSPDVLAEGWLSEAERTALAAMPVRERGWAATVSWTQKEAVLKGWGMGLPGGAASVPTPVGHREATIAGWSVRPVAVPDGHVASVALRAAQGARARPSDPDAGLPTTEGTGT